jgi:hypothetical protein
VLKKAGTAIALAIAAAAGAPLNSAPAYAQANVLRGWHSHFSHHSHHRNRNWNGNHHRARIFIRIYVYNKNNNHAVALVARPHRREERPAVVLRDPGVLVGRPVVGGLNQGVRTTRDVARPQQDTVGAATPNTAGTGTPNTVGADRTAGSGLRTNGFLDPDD